MAAFRVRFWKKTSLVLRETPRDKSDRADLVLGSEPAMDSRKIKITPVKAIDESIQLNPQLIQVGYAVRPEGLALMNDARNDTDTVDCEGVFDVRLEASKGSIELVEPSVEQILNSADQLLAIPEVWSPTCLRLHQPEQVRRAVEV